MRKVIIACDSYKGCLTSKEVNEAMADASEVDSLQVVSLEISDGGEGMLDAFLSAMGGERMTMHVHDALMRWIDAAYGIVRLTDKNEVAGFKAGDEVAIIEIAQAAGLVLIEPEQRNPMKATSWGVGEMIMNAYRRGIRKFVVGLGGSATSDCGIGMLKAMGDDWKKIRKDCSFVLASDVTNPLCGLQGAAHIFAPQKGADAEMVEMLDKRAEKFAEVSDKQTLMGKLPQRIMKHCLTQRKKVWLVSGGVSDEQALLDAGFDRVVAVSPKDMPLEEAMKPEVAKENIWKIFESFGKEQQ